jgi:signal transduction histidine kinase
VLALSTVRSERTWPDALIERLRLVAEVLCGILARKHAELEVEESRELQRAIWSSLPSLMAVLDRKGQILAVNRAWLDDPRTNDASPAAHLGVGRNYLEAAREAVLAGVPGARDVLAAVQAALADTRELSEVEYKGVGRSSDRWFRLSAMALRGSKGGAVIAYTDVTDHVLAHEQLQQFSGQLLAAQEEERRRIARELHDDFNQRLVLLALEISQPERDPARDNSAGETGRRVAERLGEIASDVHRLAYRLHPFKLEYLGLTAAARGFCQEIATAHEITIEFAERDVPSGLPREVALCVYRVLQEALSNVVHHSGSAYAKVELCGDDAGLSLTVRDFGAGIAREAAANTHGLGLASMRERLRLVNGTLSVDSSQAGTQLEVQIPIPVLAPVR